MLTQEYLKSRVIYNPDTGIFTWKLRDIQTWDKRYSGKKVGGVDGKGYLHVLFFSKWCRLHRLAFLYMNGLLPKGEIDHINHDRLDNRWVNLREVTVSENRRNQTLSSKSTCGIQGVYFQKSRNKWIAQIKVNRQHHYLGSFPDIKSAAKARLAAEIKHGFHPNHGLPIQLTIENAPNA